MFPGSVSILSQSAKEFSGSIAEIFEILATGTPSEKRNLVGGSLLALFGGTLTILSIVGYLPSATKVYGFGLFLMGFGAYLAAIGSVHYRKSAARTQIVNDLEQRARSEPAEPQLAWDLARIKLENYLDRNLRQVSSIYYLTLMVMTFGMTLIGIGIWRAIMAPESMQAASLAALAGILVQVIGGTILIIYRSTMAQAKDYVIVLERINAVGMSINILEGIEAATEMRDTARVELSTTLLSMYAVGPAASPPKRRRAKR